MSDAASRTESAAERLHADLARERTAVRRDLVLTAATVLGTVSGVIAALSGAPGVAAAGYALAYLAGGVPTAVQAVRSLRQRHLDIDLLMLLAALAAAAVGEARDGAILLLLFRAAETAEAYAMGTTRRAVAGLMRLRPDTARLANGPADAREVPVEEVDVGTVVRVLPGERVPEKNAAPSCPERISPFSPKNSAKGRFQSTMRGSRTGTGRSREKNTSGNRA